MPFTEGEQVGAYRIIEKLGQGGMATVFKAYHANLDRYVAIKVLHPAFMEDESFLARFEREAKVVAKLEHPHIIPVYDFAEHEGHPYLVMKYVEGETLKARLKKHPLSLEEGVEIIQAVGDALSYAHSQGILHRDIKPSNVMLAADGQIYLTDFGLARIASAGESTLSSDMMIGTPQYISPEQAMGKRNLDAGTDIYSFGVLIYELVVGRVPFSADTPFSIVHDHIYTPLPLPRAVNPKVPEVVERLLLKALAKERADRFESVDEMVNAFRQAIRGEDLDQVWVDPSTYTPTQTPQPVAISKQQVAAQQIAAQQAAAQQPGAQQALPPGPYVQAKPQKPFWRWWYSIPLGMVLCVCLLLIIGALSDKPTDLPVADLNQPTQVDEAIVETVVAEAEQHVEENPDDPYAYLDMAAALLDAGDSSRAQEMFDTGSEMAGDDGQFHLMAGDMLASRALWVDALKQYADAMKMAPEMVTNENSLKFQTALYFAAANQDAQFLLFGVAPENIPDELGTASYYAAQARFNLLVLDEPDLALDLVNGVLAENPDNAMARLVHAEILMKTGQVDEAQTALQELVDETSVPSWVQNQARVLLSQID